MASGLTDFGEDKVLDSLYSATALGAPATFHIALMTAAGNETAGLGGGTEATGGGYARIAVTNNATNFPASSGGSKTNGTAFSSATSTGAWSSSAAIVQIRLMDASSGGNCWAYADIDVGNQQAITAANQVFQIPASQLTLSIT